MQPKQLLYFKINSLVITVNMHIIKAYTKKKKQHAANFHTIAELFSYEKISYFAALFYVNTMIDALITHWLKAAADCYNIDKNTKQSKCMNM